MYTIYIIIILNSNDSSLESQHRLLRRMSGYHSYPAPTEAPLPFLQYAQKPFRHYHHFLHSPQSKESASYRWNGFQPMPLLVSLILPDRLYRFCCQSSTLENAGLLLSANCFVLENPLSIALLFIITDDIIKHLLFNVT